jgi:hypothetical protein
MPSSKDIKPKFIQLIDFYIYFKTKKIALKIPNTCTFQDITKKPCDNNLFVGHLSRFFRFLNNFLLGYQHKIHTAYRFIYPLSNKENCI